MVQYLHFRILKISHWQNANIMDETKNQLWIRESTAITDLDHWFEVIDSREWRALPKTWGFNCSAQKKCACQQEIYCFWQFIIYMDSGQKTLGIVGEAVSFFDLHPHPSNKVAWLQIPAKWHARNRWLPKECETSPQRCIKSSTMPETEHKSTKCPNSSPVKIIFPKPTFLSSKKRTSV